MAEAIGLTASIIAIVDLSAKLASHCKFYIENVKDARADFRKLLIEITSIGNAIDILQFLIDHDPDFESDQLSTLSGGSGPIAGCRDALARLEAMIPHPDDTNPSSAQRTMKKRMNDIATRLAWPLNKTRAMGVLDDIMKYKTNIFLIISGDISKDVKEIKVVVRDVQQKLTSHERERLLQWLTDINPSDKHRIASELYEKGTGDWVLRDTSWQLWVDPEAEQPRCLWLNGIPGAGKTILVSHLFDILKETHGNWQPPQASQHLSSTSSESNMGQRSKYGNRSRLDSLSITHVYYYCHHTRNHDETLPLLRWIINQLCRQSEIMPQQLIDLYRSGCQPGTSQLLDILERSIDFWDSIYLLVDAVDESAPRTDLLNLLRRLSTEPRFRKLKVLAASRIYRDISDEMIQFSESINMSNSFVEEDIWLFTLNDLERRRRTSQFKFLDHDFMDYAAKVIAKKAQGMFRWAVCQIDTLRRLQFKDESFLRNVLQTMPIGLDAAYDKMFELITEEADDDGRTVRDALSWICNHTKLYPGAGISIKVLIQALYPETQDPRTTERQILQKKNDLHEALGCLVRFQEKEVEDVERPDWWSNKAELPFPAVVFLAHYTVAEYLTSDRVRTTAAKCFVPQEPTPFFESMVMTAMQSTIGITSCPWPPFDHNIKAYQLRSSFPLLVGQSHPVEEHFSLSRDHPYVLQFFNPEAPHFDDARQLAKALHSMEFISYSGDIATTLCQVWTLQVAASHQDWELLSTTKTLMALLELGFYDLVKRLLSWLEVPLLEAILTESKRWQCGFQLQHLNERPHKYYTYEFEGTLPQWLASLPCFDRNRQDDSERYLDTYFGAFVAIFLAFAPYFVRKTPGLLLNVVASHGEVTSRWCHHDGHGKSEFDCIIATLLEHGANPQPSSFGITPLQIAVSQGDFFATKALLEAGVDCNGLGTVGGHFFGSREPLSRYNSLHGISPLYIHERLFTRPIYSGHNLKSEEKSRRIGQLLRNHGARAERVSHPGSIAGCEVDEEVNARGLDGRSDDEVPVHEYDF